jgi:GTP-binding protein
VKGAGIKSFYLGASPRAHDDLNITGVEIALSGRSNVGKSTLLNAILQAKVARTSQTPGRTRLLHFFRVPGSEGVLVDLPGLGYAKASKGVASKLKGLVLETLEARESLRAVLVLVDARREPGAVERLLLDKALKRGLKVLLVATKADQLPKHKIKPVTFRLAKWAGLPDYAVIAVSGRTGYGMDQLRSRLQRWVDHGTQEGAPDGGPTTKEET